MSRHLFYACRAAPLLGLLSGLVTLIGTFFLCSYYGHLPPGLNFPFISLNGVQFPENVLYSAGFVTTALCIFGSAYFARKYMFSVVEIHLQSYASVSFWSATVAAVGLALQAVVPLQSDILSVIAGTSPLRAQSGVHQMGALVLFFAGYMHCISSNVLLWKSRTIRTDRKSCWFKTVLTISAISPFFISFIPHPASGGTGTLDEMTEGAIGQWICVMSLLLYFASYQIEFNTIRYDLSSQIGRASTHSAEDQGRDMNPLLK